MLHISHFSKAMDKPFLVVSSQTSLLQSPRQLLLYLRRPAEVLHLPILRDHSQGSRALESGRTRCREGGAAQREGNVGMQRRDQADSA